MSDESQRALVHSTCLQHSTHSFWMLLFPSERGGEFGPLPRPPLVSRRESQRRPMASDLPSEEVLLLPVITPAGGLDAALLGSAAQLLPLLRTICTGGAVIQ